MQTSVLSWNTFKMVCVLVAVLQYERVAMGREEVKRTQAKQEKGTQWLHRDFYGKENSHCISTGKRH